MQERDVPKPNDWKVSEDSSGVIAPTPSDAHGVQNASGCEHYQDMYGDAEEDGGTGIWTPSADWIAAMDRFTRTPEIQLWLERALEQWPEADRQREHIHTVDDLRRWALQKLLRE